MPWGAAAVVGAVTIRKVRVREGRTTVPAISSAAFAAGSTVSAAVAQQVVVARVLVITGIGWLFSLSTLNTTSQLPCLSGAGPALSPST